LHEGAQGFSYAGCRCRAQVYHEKNGVGVCLRILPQDFALCEALNLPSALLNALDKMAGLILITGATGQGKTTTLTSLIHTLNQSKAYHIVSLEDPIEYVHAPIKSMITQRELGVHLQTFAKGLKDALRQAPNVIVVGEIREAETMKLVLEAASTGHLVLSSLHTANVASTFQRLAHFFEDKSGYLNQLLSETLLVVQSQRLYYVSGQAQLDHEILINTPAVKSLIQKGDFLQIKALMETGQREGMQLFKG